MNAKDREITLHALVALMRLVCGSKRTNVGEIIAAAKPEHIVSMASAHKLMPSIASAFELSQIEDIVDPELAEFFQFIRKENADRNQIILKQLSTLAEGFEVRGLEPPVVLKGASFLLQAPEIPTDRFMVDIDFFVAPNDFDAVIVAMKEMNYSPQEGIKFDPHTGLHYPAFIHPDHDCSVEIHFRLAQINMPNWLEWDAVVQHSKLVQLPKGTIYLPDNEWRLAHLIYHCQINGHYYNRLIKSLRDCIDYFDLVIKQDVDLASVRSKLIEAGARKEMDGIIAFNTTIFGGMLPVGVIAYDGKRWAKQSRSALIHTRHRTFWLLVDWVLIFTHRVFDINSWKAAFRLISNKDHLRARLNHWWSQFKNRHRPDG